MPEQQTLDAFTGAVCPTCGRDDFANENGVKIHHTRAHGGSIAGVEVECTYCGKTFRRVKSKVEQHDKHFCSHECQGAYRRHPVSASCDYCGETFQRRESERRYDNQYCSLECHHAHRSEIGRTRITCDYCGKACQKWKREVRQSDNNFCSRECHSAWQSENQVGENHPCWRGGYDEYYGQSWYRQRRAALDRADAQCEICALARDDHYALYGQDLHVHHKVPFRVFGVENHEQANALDNLVVVCRSCHDQLEPVSQERATAAEVSTGD